MGIATELAILYSLLCKMPYMAMRFPDPPAAAIYGLDGRANPDTQIDHLRHVLAEVRRL